MASEFELKPCPFCGGNAEYDICDGKYVWYVYVKCVCCGARVLGGTDISETPRKSKAAYHAYCKWNLRINEKGE